MTMSILRLFHTIVVRARRYFLAGLLAVTVMLAGTGLPAAEKTGWFSDIPVLAETKVNAQLSFAFDSPSGRILVLFLQTDTDDGEFVARYGETLASIGWQQEAERFTKQGEQLRLEKIEVQNEMFWRLTLLPATANQLEIR